MKTCYLVLIVLSLLSAGNAALAETLSFQAGSNISHCDQWQRCSTPSLGAQGNVSVELLSTGFLNGFDLMEGDWSKTAAFGSQTFRVSVHVTKYVPAAGYTGTQYYTLNAKIEAGGNDQVFETELNTRFDSPDKLNPIELTGPKISNPDDSSNRPILTAKIVKP